MSLTRILIFTLWVICEKANFIDCDVVFNSLDLSQQSSEIHQIKNELKMLREQNERILQDLVQTKTDLPRSCKEVQHRGHNITDVYLIRPDLSPNSFVVLCDMEKRGGGWVYLLNRFNGSQDFYLDWSEYKKGFGSLRGEFWLGLDNIHYLTGYEINELLVELVDFNNTEAYAHYDLFSVGSEAEGYSLKLLGLYDGTAGDSLGLSARMKFSTKDKDQDYRTTFSCVGHYGGAWWYESCMNALLTGRYGDHKDPEEEEEMQWMHWGGFRKTDGLKQARMMIRPRQNINPILLPHDKRR